MKITKNNMKKIIFIFFMSYLGIPRKFQEKLQKFIVNSLLLYIHILTFDIYIDIYVILLYDI